MSTDTIIVERFFEADAETLYEAWTDPEVMVKWFFVGEDWSAEIESDLRVGGAYRLSMITAVKEAHTMHGEYLELEPGRRVKFTWNSHVADDTLVTIDLDPREGGTMLTLTHELVPTPESRAAHRAGWGGCLENLARTLAAP